MSMRSRPCRFIEPLESRTLLSVAEPNDTLSSAYAADQLGNGFGGMVTFEDSISDTDQRDFYRVSFAGYFGDGKISFTARLSGLSANLQLALIRDLNYDQITDTNELYNISVNSGTTGELIVRSGASALNPDVNYYVQVYSAGGGNNTGYTLELIADTAGDTAATARRLTPITGGHTVLEMLNNTDDLYDIFRIDLESFGNLNNQSTFSAKLLSGGDHSNWRLDLLQDLNNNKQFDSGELISTGAVGTSGILINPLTVSVNSGHAYYLRVLHGSPQTEIYSLRTLVDHAGNSIATARSLSSVDERIATAEDFVGSISLVTYNDPNDYYKFTVVNPPVTVFARLEAQFESEPNGLVSYEIFRDANENGVKDSNEPFLSTGSIAKVESVGGAFVAPPGTYYARVTSNSWVNYKFYVHGDTVAGFSKAARYSESRDYGALRDQRRFDEALGVYDYADTYKFSFATPGSIIVRLEESPYDANNVSGTVNIDKDGDGLWEFGDTILTFTPGNVYKVSVPAGAVYVSLAPTIFAESHYELIVTPDYAGDTPQTARNIGALGSGAFQKFDDHMAIASSGYSLADPDYYKFNVSSTQTFTAALYGQDIEPDAEIVLYSDSAGTLTELQRVAGAESRKFLQRSISAGSYQVLVQNKDAEFLGTEYSIGFSTGDNDDQIEEARLLPGSTVIPGTGRDLTLGDAGDVDLILPGEYVEFGHFLAIDLDSRNGSNVDTHLRIFDATGKQIASNDNGAAPGEAASGFSYLAYRFAISGFYYIGISSKGNANYSAVTGTGDAGGSSTGQYRLNITDITGTRGSIAGVVFNDLNGSGVKDANEAGIKDRAVFTDNNGNNQWDDEEEGTFTDAAGAYKLVSIPPGTYAIRQRIPSGWTQTSPAGGAALSVTLTAGQNATGKNFGVRQGTAPTTGSISGFVYHDSDGDGVKDSNESGIASRTVYIDADNDSILDAGEKSTTTDTTGKYTLLSLNAGTYKVREIVPAGWSQTFPTNNFGLNATITTEQNATGKNFFVRQNAGPTGGSISGFVYNDLDGDGVKDTNEVGIAGRTVFIDLDNDSALDAGEKSAVTNASGQYTLTSVAAGTHKVRQVRPAGWIQTFPLNNFGLSVTITNGQNSVNHNFFTKQSVAGSTGAISGNLFKDLDRDGVKETGDNGLVGWTVYLDADNDSILDATEKKLTTDTNGNYTFTALAAGAYKIRIVLQAGYVQTIPTSNFGHNATLSTNSSIVTGKNFGADN